MTNFNIAWDSYCDNNKAFYRHACRRLGYTGTLDEYCLDYLMKSTNDDVTKNMIRYFYDNRFEYPTYEKYMGQLVLDKKHKADSEEKFFKRALKDASGDSLGTGGIISEISDALLLANFVRKNICNERIRAIVLFFLDEKVFESKNKYELLKKKGYDIAKIQKWNDDVCDIVSYLKNLKIVFCKKETFEVRRKALHVVMNSRIGQCFDEHGVECYNRCVLLGQVDEFLLDLDDNFEEDIKVSATKNYFIEDIRLRNGRIVLVNAKKYRRYGVCSNWLISYGKEF